MSHPWYAFYPRDFRDKTSGLTMVQDGAYRRLMDEYFITGKPLSAIAGFLPRVCRAVADDEKAAIEHVLATYFWLDAEGDGCWHHDRIDEELEKRAELSQKRSVAGGKGADKTNGKRPAKMPATKRQLPTHPHPQSQENSNKKEPTVPVVPVVVVPKAIPIQIPEWIPVEPWEAFAAMRKKQRKPLTDYATELLIGRLSKLRTAGEDIGAVLDQSTLKCWQDVFAIKKEGPRHDHNGKSASSSFGSTVSRAVEERAASRAAGQGGRSDVGPSRDGLEDILGEGHPQLRLAHHR